MQENETYHGCPYVGDIYPDEIDVLKLIKILLDEPWHARCKIIPDYMPPFPRPDTVPTVKVCYDNGTEYPAFLRYSKGPHQCYFWDVYGDDMQSMELAVFALSHAPAPVSVAPIVTTFEIKPRKPIP